MVTLDIRFIAEINPIYFKFIFSPLVIVDYDCLGITDKRIIGSNLDNLLSVITEWCCHVKYIKVGVSSNGSL